MPGSTLLRIGLFASLALAPSAASATPIFLVTAGKIAILPYASQVITYHYDPSGRLVAVVHSGTGAPNGCANSSPVWGSGALGCFRWGS